MLIYINICSIFVHYCVNLDKFENEVIEREKTICLVSD